MGQRQEVTTILDRIAAGEYNSADVESLRRIGVHGNRNSVTVGDHNISLSGAREIRIDNRVYYGTDADSIRNVLTSLGGFDGTGSLRGFGGVVKTIGLLVALAGMGMFFYGIISVMSGGFKDGGGFPPILLSGFAVAAIGVGIGIVGGLISGWSRQGGR